MVENREVQGRSELLDAVPSLRFAITSRAKLERARSKILKIAEILKAFEVSTGHRPKRSGKNWLTRCPSHPDHNPSLSISEGRGKRVVICCHAGCAVETLVGAIGIEMKDLFQTEQLSRSRAVASLPKSSRRGREIVALYDYRNETGALLYQVVRYEPKDFRQRRPNGDGTWTYNLDGIQPVLYRLPELQSADSTSPVHIVEGEKDCDRLWSLGLVATTCSQGAGKWRERHSESLRDRDVVVFPDNDDAGRKHAQEVAKSLHGIARSVRVLELPGLPPKGDVSDWLDAGGDETQLRQMVEKAAAWLPSNADLTEGTDTGVESVTKIESSRILAISVATSKAELWHDADNEPYATIEVDGHAETHGIDGTGFRSWICGEFFASTGQPLHGETLTSALATLRAIAIYRGAKRSVHLRLGEHEGALYLDLADDKWGVVEIGPTGWHVIAASEAPVRFIRRRGMRSLPEPVKGGQISELRPLINVGTDQDTWVLIVAWLVGSLHPIGPYPILSLSGEQGAAKSTTARILRALIDPQEAELRAAPKDERDLMIAASNSLVIALDNLSGIPQSLSDALCRLATGAGFATRQLFTDREEAIIRVARPIIVTGIDDSGRQSDLMDRSIQVTLPPVSDRLRKEERELWNDFRAAHGRILGALLDAVSLALANSQKVHLPALPRMADFTKWVVAAEPALGFPIGSFLAAYNVNRDSAHADTLERPPVPELISLLEGQADQFWSGTSSQLLKALNSLVASTGTDPVHRRDWPKSAEALGRMLRRLAPNLRAHGIEITDSRLRRMRLKTIRRLVPLAAQ